MTEKLAYTIAEAAEALTLHPSTVKELVQERRLKVVRVGRRVIVPRWALDEFLATPAIPALVPDWDKMLEDMER